MALDIRREVADSVTNKNSPDCREPFDGSAAAGANQNPEAPVTETVSTASLFANLEQVGVPLSPRQLELDRTAKLGKWHDGPLVEFRGIVSRWTAHGHFLYAAVRDVDEFVAHYGEPVTHERAAVITIEQDWWAPGWWDAWDKAVAEFAQDCLDAAGDVS